MTWKDEILSSHSHIERIAMSYLIYFYGIHHWSKKNVLYGGNRVVHNLGHIIWSYFNNTQTNKTLNA